MGQVAFDTQEFVETLETAGLPKEQAKAISIAVRKSHEVADVATKADIVEVKHEIAEVNRNVADVRKDLTTQIADVRKDLSAEIADVRKDLSAEIAGVRKDLENKMDKLGLQLTVRLGGMLIVGFGAMTALLKLLS